MNPTDLRIGQGFDVHAFAPDRKLILGGIEIPHHVGLLGHSDADVPVHAIIDALSGAANLGDIGKLFPDTDPRYKGISSLLLLERVRELLCEKGWEIVNVDTTIVAEEPKISPHRTEMQEKIAGTLCIENDRVSIKATTTEHLGFTGRKEGIAAFATCLLLKARR